MNEIAAYTDHAGRRIEVGRGSVYRKGPHDLWSFALEYGDGSDPTTLRVKPRELEATVCVDSQTEDGGAEARLMLHDMLSSDSMARSAGTIEREDGYSMQVVPVSSEETSWWMSGRWCVTTVRFLAPRPVWSKPRTWKMTKREAEHVGLDFPYDHPVDLGASYASSGSVDNSSAVAPSRFRLVVYGPARNPSVSIGGNSYAVSCDVRSGGLLVIDSTKKGLPGELPIALYDPYGNVENAFPMRERGIEGSGSYVFQDIPAADAPVVWDGSFAWDVTVYDERLV